MTDLRGELGVLLDTGLLERVDLRLHAAQVLEHGRQGLEHLRLTGLTLLALGLLAAVGLELFAVLEACSLERLLQPGDLREGGGETLLDVRAVSGRLLVELRDDRLLPRREHRAGVLVVGGRTSRRLAQRFVDRLVPRAAGRVGVGQASLLGAMLVDHADGQATDEHAEHETEQHETHHFHGSQSISDRRH
ncbi:hypothetical protein GCM10009798_38820 [Nocardioides panacihumi]|uniref:Uncharacterized protein n=1 Tax=Nocardioides panacihumi TaxID=400774 RepID=A0ABP5D5R2_9ACTN